MINYSGIRKRQLGVTLLEMMITLAIAAILLTVVAPNVQSILTRNRITAEINDMSGLLQFARYTAIDEQANTVVCPSDNFDTCVNSWNSPKIVFIDANANGSRDANEELLLTSQAIANTNTMTASNNLIQFLDTGGASANTTIKLCPNTNDASFARELLVSMQGRTRLSRDSNNDGTHEGVNGSNLSCP